MYLIAILLQHQQKSQKSLQMKFTKFIQLCALVWSGSYFLPSGFLGEFFCLFVCFFSFYLGCEGTVMCAYNKFLEIQSRRRGEREGEEREKWEEWQMHGL